MSEKIIVFATTNQGKMKEVKMILGELGVTIKSLKEIEETFDIKETGKTFEENAIIKAKTVAQKLGCIVLADDSGLEVDYLNRAPGVYSARYMGEDTSYDVKNKHIIQLLERADEGERTARFVCAIACCLPTGEEKVVRATVEGKIAHEQSGNGGFGYDPIFVVPEFNCTMAELSAEQKNMVSHRGKALRAMREEIKDFL